MFDCHEDRTPPTPLSLFRITAVPSRFFCGRAKRACGSDKPVLDKFPTIITASTFFVLVLAVTHEWGYFWVIGTHFQTLMSPSDYLSSGLLWLPYLGIWFARGFFVETRRDRLPKVPACQPCNQVKSGLEHYLATVLPFAGRHADAPASLPTPRGLLAARRRPRRALNVGYRSSVASTMDRRRLSPSMPSIHTCCDTPAASGSQRWPGHPLVAALSRSQEYPASPDRFKDFWR
jgi:hypothetical protein